MSNLQKVTMMPATHMAIVQEGEKSEGASTQGRVDHSRPTVRSAVPWYEKLLLVSVLLVVAGWVIFRLLRTLLTLD
jgi:hypothetical protein